LPSSSTAQAVLSGSSPQSAAEALYYGPIAGLAQEAAKLGAILIPAHRRSWAGAAVGAGAGFALMEILLLGISSLAQAPHAGLGALGLPLLERTGAVLLHVGAAGLIGWGCAGGLRRLRWGLLLAVLAHAVPDTAVEVLAMRQLQSGAPLLGFELANLAWGALIYALAILLLRGVPAVTPARSTTGSLV